jgi:crotonobetainyl-CoA:carnitine CoA-transferase CaiB-like acyl-CoA transferase
MTPDVMPASHPLHGVRVLDLSRVLAGPWSSQILADYGADVIKVERPGNGDDTRAWGPPYFGDPAERMSAYYLSCNRGKRSVAVDLAAPAGADLVRALARDADVVLENYKVGQLGKYGLDYDSLRALNPRLVYCSITGFGQDGPYAHAAGYDFAIQATGGLMSVTGEKEGTPGSEPQKVGVAVADLFTGLYATTAILAALRRAAQTGQGCHIDAALLDVQVAMLANQASNHLIGGITPRRMGNAHANVVPYQVLPTQDGHMVLAIGNDGQFARFCKLAGHPEVAADARFATNSARLAHREALIPLIAGWLLARGTQDWCALLEPNAVPCAPILDLPQVFRHPQVMQRGMQVALPDARGRDVPQVANPMRFDGRRALAATSSPALDDNGADIRAGHTWLPR